MNYFRHLPDDIIEINGEQFDLELFLEIESEYTLPDGISYREYIPEKHHILQSKTSQIQGEYPWEDGDRYILRVPDIHLLEKIIKEDNDYVKEIHDKNTKPEKNKLDEYPQITELVVAMWEHFVEGKPAEKTINIVQEKRLKVKEKYSK